MKLGEWIQREITEGRASGKKDAYRRLSEATKAAGAETVCLLTVEDAAGGKKIVKYGKAKAISVATAGAVTIAELCE